MKNKTMILHHYENDWQECYFAACTSFEKIGEMLEKELLIKKIKNLVITTSNHKTLKNEYENIVDFCSKNKINIDFKNFKCCENNTSLCEDSLNKENYDIYWIKDLPKDFFIYGCFDDKCLLDLIFSMRNLKKNPIRIDSLIVL